MRQDIYRNEGYPFYRLRTAKDTVVIVVTLLAYGCPVRAIVAAFGLDERTVVDWQERAGQHCEKVRACALCRPLLFYVDGCPAYIQAIRTGRDVLVYRFGE